MKQVAISKKLVNHERRNPMSEAFTANFRGSKRRTMRSLHNKTDFGVFASDNSDAAQCDLESRPVARARILRSQGDL